jgi:hypothetical protein
MTRLRSPAHDPRTIARDIPGVLDALFPQLAQGVVASINRRSVSLPHLKAVTPELVEASGLQKAMLFEVAVAAAEQLVDQRKSIDWDMCLEIAAQRQREHFDAAVPRALSETDMVVALWVAKNLFAMLEEFRSFAPNEKLIRAPMIPGYQWIASGVGDFSVGTTLIEVKCTNKRFSSSDYRQILMYWLLGYCAAIESGKPEWSSGILVNPRLNLFVRFSFDEIILVVGGGQSKVELVELFSAIIGSRSTAKA